MELPFNLSNIASFLNYVSVFLCRLFINLLMFYPLNLVFIYVFYRISISRAHCYVVLTLFSLSSSPNDTLQLLVENQQFLSGIRNLWKWRKQDIPYISFFISLEIFHLIFNNNDLLPPRPHITLLLVLSKPLREIFPLWVSTIQNFQNVV